MTHHNYDKHCHPARPSWRHFSVWLIAFWYHCAALINTAWAIYGFACLLIMKGAALMHEAQQKVRYRAEADILALAAKHTSAHCWSQWYYTWDQTTRHQYSVTQHIVIGDISSIPVFQHWCQLYWSLAVSVIYQWLYSLLWPCCHAGWLRLPLG